MSSRSGLEMNVPKCILEVLTASSPFYLIAIDHTDAFLTSREWVIIMLRKKAASELHFIKAGLWSKLVWAGRHF